MQNENSLFQYIWTTEVTTSYTYISFIQPAVFVIFPQYSVNKKLFMVKKKKEKKNSPQAQRQINEIKIIHDHYII